MTSRQLYIEKSHQRKKTALIEDDRLAEFYQEEDQPQGRLGSVYRARVDRVLPGMEAAFVDIGQKKNAYLPLRELLNRKERRGDLPAIENLIKSGQEILVQIVKESFEDKGARLTSQISLNGQYLVLITDSQDIHISRKIEDSKKRKKLEEIGRQIRDGTGIIFRTAALEADRQELEEEYQELLDSYHYILRQRNFLPTPKLIYRDLSLMEKAIRDYRPETIISNDRDSLDFIQDFLKELDQDQEVELIHQADFAMTQNRIIAHGLDQALNKKVNLASAGYIIIEETQALTVIDVNTGGFTGQNDLEQTFLECNLQAADEIARQIRLRRLAGIIIIDFIAMTNQDHIDQLTERLGQALALYKNPAQIHGMTKLGLMELSRRRRGPSLLQTLGQTCPRCQGRILVDW